MAALVSFDRVTRRFGDFTAVDDLSLDIHEREFFALLGPSGCGKTTLLRMLAGFEAPDAGRVTLVGQDLAGIPPYRRPVNMMFQSYALFPHMTVAGNVAFGLKQDGLPKHEIAARVEEMLALVQLSGYAARKPTSFPAASASAWRSRVRSPSAPRCCCSTSRSRRSTANCARKRDLN
jgi:putrescine transport system ATP-binding protein